MDYQTGVELDNENNLGLTSEGDRSSFPVELEGDEDVLFTARGLPAAVLLKRDTAWRNIVFKKGSYLRFNSSNGVASGTLASDQQILQMRKNFLFQAGSQIYFYENGVVRRGQLNSINQVIDKPYEFYVTKHSWITFFDNGTLNTATMMYPLEVGGNNTIENAETFFSRWDPSKNILPSIRSTTFQQDTIWGEYTAKNKEPVSFHDGANLKEPGKIAGFIAATDIVVQSMIARQGKKLTFFPNGIVRYIAIGAELTIQGILVKPDETDVYMHDNGQISWLISSHKLVVKGKEYRPWTRIELDNDGNVISPK